MSRNCAGAAGLAGDLHHSLPAWKGDDGAGLSRLCRGYCACWLGARLNNSLVLAPQGQGSLHGIHGGRGDLHLGRQQRLVHGLLLLPGRGHGGLVQSRHLPDAVPLQLLICRLLGFFLPLLPQVAAGAGLGLATGHGLPSASGGGGGGGSGTGAGSKQGLQSQKTDGHAERVHGVQAGLFDGSAPVVDPLSTGFPLGGAPTLVAGKLSLRRLCRSAAVLPRGVQTCISGSRNCRL